MGRLDLGASFAAAVSLVEWPERLSAAQLPKQRLELWIDILGEVRRCLELPGVGGLLAHGKPDGWAEGWGLLQCSSG